ncbi:MAG: TldD/PmbA family protein [Deltaproteobacteria bacterium]|nr:TldD/PmbA family protein [Deltaproteobacteria bacterium]
MSRPAGAIDPLEVAERVVERALRAGATACDAVVVEAESSSTTVRLGEVETVKLSRERRLGLRCFAGEASAVASTADFDAAAIDAFARQVVELARAVAPDPFSGLPDPALLAGDWPDLELYDPTGLEMPPEDRVARAKSCEAAALACDPRLVNSEGADFALGSAWVAYASSAGFAGQYRSTSYSLSVAPVANEGGAMQRDYWYDAARSLSRLADPETIGRTAAARTLRRLGARPVPTQQVPIVFDPQTAASLVGHLAGAVCGGALYRRASFLLGKLGDEIASPLFTVIDDGRMPRGLASRPFDAEGTATRRTVVVERGVLRSYLLDGYAARKLAMASTGSAARSVGDVPSASPTNFHLAAGEHSPERIVASVQRGLYVTGLSGFGVNSVTGDYSRGASGLWIENGELTHPVEEVTIAGNLLEMYRDVEMVGNDLLFRSSIVAPTLKIRQMTLAGR